MADKIFQATLPQQDILFEDLLYPGVPVNNIGAVVIISGGVNTSVFEASVKQVICENEMLHTVVTLTGAKPDLKILEKFDAKLSQHDLSNEQDPDRAAEEYIKREFHLVFDLEAGEMLNKFYLIKVRQTRYLFFSKYHHSITDGWGTSLIFKRLTEIYNALINKQFPLPVSVNSYLDFVKDDIAYRISNVYTLDGEYWKTKLLPPSGPMIPRIRTDVDKDIIPCSGHYEIFIERNFYREIIALATSMKSSCFHIFLGILFTYYSRIYLNTGFAIGIPILNRGTSAFKKTIGLFAGIIPFKVNFDPSIRFYDLIQMIKDELRNNYRHQRYPLGSMVRDIKLDHPEIKGLFDIFLSYEKHDYAYQFGDLNTEVEPLSNHHERVPMALYVREFDDSKDVKIDLNFNLSFYDYESARVLSAHIKALLKSIVAFPNSPLCDLDFMAPDEEKTLLYEFNNTDSKLEENYTFLDLFATCLDEDPYRTAVIDEGGMLTYQQLGIQAQALATYLIDSAGVAKGDVVGLVTDRSAASLIGLLGIFMAGATYLPLDENLPEYRISHIVETSSVNIILTNLDPLITKKFAALNKISLIVMQNHAQVEYGGKKANLVDSAALAYILFTSGSTGKPKGVEITHRSLYNFIRSMIKKPGFLKRDRLLAVTTFLFDISFLELLVPLASGGCVILLCKEQITDPHKLR
jgi:non-ribosomal peptide synthetase component F